MKTKLSVAAAIICGAAAMSANAGVIVQNVPLVLETTEINQLLTVNQFDSSLGTLTDVEIKLTGQAVSEASLTNTAAQAQLFSFSSDLALLLTGAGVNDVLNIPLLSFGPGLIQVGQTVAIGPEMPMGMLTANVAAADFGAWTGAGSIDLSCQSLVSNTQAGGGGNIDVVQSTQAGCGAMVTYTFDEPPPPQIPVPAPMALLGLGLLGLGLMRKRA